MQKHGKIEKLIRIEKEINSLRDKKEKYWQETKYIYLYAFMTFATVFSPFIHPLLKTTNPEWYIETTLSTIILNNICALVIVIGFSQLCALAYFLFFSKKARRYDKKETIINRKLKKLRKEAKLTIDSLEITDVIIEKEMLLKSKYRNNLMIINALKSVELKNNLNKAYWNAYNLIEEKYKSLGFWSETVNKKTFDEMKKDFLNKGLTLDQLEERIELMETKVNLNKKNLIVY